ncbi:MAG TPA: ThuA domain-containing protein [Verrucomicrobiae bacterium]|nr:ThuA domain-containing protein [Verrucomicrobiae bacterium]
MHKFVFLTALCLAATIQAAPIRVVVWDEQNLSEKKVYTNYVGGQIASYLKTLPGLTVKSVGLNDTNEAFSDETLTNCDVLVWWSHTKNKSVPVKKAREITQLVKDGKLSVIFLHSSISSRPFIELMNERTREDAAKEIPAGVKTEFVLPTVYKDPLPTDPLTPRIEMTNAPDGSKLARVFLPICEITGWREAGIPSHVTTLLPDHPIARGVPAQFDIPQTEYYVEPFHVPKPDAVIFQETWAVSGPFRSGMLWTIGKGKVFYFRPGHETFTAYFNTNVLKIIGNAVEWLGGKKS